MVSPYRDGIYKNTNTEEYRPRSIPATQLHPDRDRELLSFPPGFPTLLSPIIQPLLSSHLEGPFQIPPVHVSLEHHPPPAALHRDRPTPISRLHLLTRAHLPPYVVDAMAPVDDVALLYPGNPRRSAYEPGFGNGLVPYPRVHRFPVSPYGAVASALESRDAACIGGHRVASPAAH